MKLKVVILSLTAIVSSQWGLPNWLGAQMKTKLPSTHHPMRNDLEKPDLVGFKIYYRYAGKGSWKRMPNQSWLGDSWRLEGRATEPLRHCKIEFKSVTDRLSRIFFADLSEEAESFMIAGHYSDLRDIGRFSLNIELTDWAGWQNVFTGGSWETIYDINPTINDVEKELSRIRTRGDYMAAWADGHVPAPWYTTNIKNLLGFKNHFQGIQRLRNTNYLVISGSNHNEPMSNLFIVKMSSRKQTRIWASNTMVGGKPPSEDAIVKTIGIDSKMWHPGGLGVLGDILAVPIYGGKPLHGKIIFYHVKNPTKPQRFDFEIDRPGRKAYAVALIKLSNDYYLAVVLSGRDKLPRRLDFYLSNSKNILDGFENKETTWLASNVRALPKQESNFGDFQSINLVRQSDDRLYLVGFHNTAPNLRIIPGRDYADLYEVVFPKETMTGQAPVLAIPVITKIANRQFFCKDGQCNMDAAIGLYVEPSGTLTVYSATFWLDEGTIKFTSFRAEPDPDGTLITNKNDAWIDLYKKKNFGGRRLSLIGTKDSNISDYENIYAQGSRFNNKISSARFQIPVGRVYRLYVDKDYQGKYKDLIGTGRIEVINNFKSSDFDDPVSSSRFINLGM